MRKNIVYISIALLLSIAPIAGATTIGLSPNGTFSFSAGQVGNIYSVDVNISGLSVSGNLSDVTSNQIVSSFDLSVLYDALLLSPVSVTFSDRLGTPGVNWLPGDTISLYDFNTSGVVPLYSVSMITPDYDLQARQAPDYGAFNLATIDFTVLQAGTTKFDFGSYIEVRGLNSEVLPVSVASSAVPEPGTFILMGSGLLSILGYRRRNSLMARFKR